MSAILDFVSRVQKPASRLQLGLQLYTQLGRYFHVLTFGRLCVVGDFPDPDVFGGHGSLCVGAAVLADDEGFGGGPGSGIGDLLWTDRCDPWGACMICSKSKTTTTLSCPRWEKKLG